MILTRTPGVALTLTARRGTLTLAGAGALSLDLRRTLVVAVEGSVAARLETRVVAIETRLDTPPAADDPVTAYLAARTFAP